MNLLSLHIMAMVRANDQFSLLQTQRSKFAKSSVFPELSVDAFPEISLDECTDGDEREVENCKTEQCFEGKWQAVAKGCPQTVCENTLAICTDPDPEKGECCPKCSCLCEDGAVEEAEDCTEKHCFGGQWFHVAKGCPRTVCDDGTLGLCVDPDRDAGECCPKCTCPCKDGATQEAEDCTEKHCYGGQWFHVAKGCPVSRCEHGLPVCSDPVGDECCPTCTCPVCKKFNDYKACKTITYNQDGSVKKQKKMKSSRKCAGAKEGDGKCTKHWPTK